MKTILPFLAGALVTILCTVVINTNTKEAEPVVETRPLINFDNDSIEFISEDGHIYGIMPTLNIEKEPYRFVNMVAKEVPVFVGKSENPISIDKIKNKSNECNEKTIKQSFIDYVDFSYPDYYLEQIELNKQSNCSYLISFRSYHKGMSKVPVDQWPHSVYKAVYNENTGLKISYRNGNYVFK